MKPRPRLYIVTFNHFDLTWRRCWGRAYTFKGETHVPCSRVEESVINEHLALARKCGDYSFPIECAAVARKYLQRNPRRRAELIRVA